MMKALADKKIIGGLVLLVGSGVVLFAFQSKGFRRGIEKTFYQVERTFTKAGDEVGTAGAQFDKMTGSGISPVGTDQTLASTNARPISENERGPIERAVQSFIDARTEHGLYPVYDSASGEMLKLKREEAPGRIVYEGDVIIACVNFSDERGRPIDIDVTVIPDGSGYRATQAVLHLVDGADRRPQ